MYTLVSKYAWKSKKIPEKIYHRVYTNKEHELIRLFVIINKLNITFNGIKLVNLNEKEANNEFPFLMVFGNLTIHVLNKYSVSTLLHPLQVLIQL